MAKTVARIEIISSTTRGLSSMSPRSQDAACEALSKYYTDVRITQVNDITDLENLVARKPDLAFLGMSFVTIGQDANGEDIKVWLSGYLEGFGIPYTGSGQLAHDLERNKHLAKERVMAAGLATAAFTVIKQNSPAVESFAELKYPLFVKPTNRGGGAGIDGNSVVHNRQQLDQKIQSIAQVNLADSLVEHYLPGREFSVAILRRGGGKPYSVMPIELAAAPNSNGAQMLGHEMKQSNMEVVSEVSDANLRARLCDFALDVFHALGARDYGRIDIRLDARGEPHFLEANLIPSLIAGYGSFPKACLLNINLDYEPMLLRIVDLALERGQAQEIGTLTTASEDVLSPAIVTL